MKISLNYRNDKRCSIIYRPIDKGFWIDNAILRTPQKKVSPKDKKKLDGNLRDVV